MTSPLKRMILGAGSVGVSLILQMFSVLNVAILVIVPSLRSLIADLMLSMFSGVGLMSRCSASAFKISA